MAPKQKSGASAWLVFFGGDELLPSSIGIIIGWWFQTFFYFNPQLGELIQFDYLVFFKWVETTN